MESRPTASIIIIGDEILKGQTRDSNSHFLCRELYKCGVHMLRVTVISDDVDVIAREVSDQSRKYSFVLTSGGIGPTHDDVTYEGVAKAFDEKLVLNKDLQSIVLQLCLNLGLDEMAVSKMSRVPESAEIHSTGNSRRASFIPIVSVKNVFIFPGIPSYLEFAFAKLKSIFSKKALPYFNQTLYVQVTEFNITEVLNKAVKEYEETVKFGSYPDVDNKHYQVKLTLEADSENALVEAEAFLRSHLPPNSIVGQHPPNSYEALQLLMNIYKVNDGDLKNCVTKSSKVLKECFGRYSIETVCLSFNGGKDCTALLHLTYLLMLQEHSVKIPRLKAFYVRSKQSFPEIEEFINLSVQRYNLELLSYDQPIKDALWKLQQDQPQIKAVLMGSRRTDPRCSALEPFQMTDSDWPQFMRVSPLSDWSYPEVWAFLRQLQVPYCSLYDKGMQNVSLKQIIACCDGLGSFVEEVLDPHSMTLVVEEMVFTQQASRILSAVEWKHPMEKIILETISLYRNQTGDDCKMFLLLLKEFMNSVGDKLETSDEAQLRKTISKEITCLMSLLPSIFKNVRNIFARLSFIQFLSFPKDLEGLVLTFFHARFSPNVSLKLTQLIYSFLSLTISNSNHAVESLSYLILNFDLFCSKVILPLSQSTVIEGFALFHQLPSNHESKDIFVIVQELPQNSHDGFYYSVNSDSFPLYFWNSLESSLKCLKFKKVSVILTSSRASDNFVSLCSQYKILIIDSITKEDIDNILYFVDISPLVTLNDPLLPQNLGCMEALKSIVIGDTCFAHLKIQVCSKSIAPNHIILCAPVEDVWKDYYSECLNCLKVVRQWLHFNFINLKHSEMTEEKCLKIQGIFKSSSGLFLDILKPTIPHEECISESAFGVAFPVGLFEFSLKMALADLQKNKLSTIKTLYDILESALLRVICKLWNISIQKLEPEKSYLKFYERIRSRISIPIEPASNKEHLVYMILQLVQQLMKIDTILYTKSRK